MVPNMNTFKFSKQLLLQTPQIPNLFEIRSVASDVTYEYIIGIKVKVKCRQLLH
jgi:hypothetical protein